MKKINKRKTEYLILFASLLVLMLGLSGCRTRLSNNSEIASVMKDEGGYLQEEYDYRRADLGLSTAEKPLINLSRAEEEEDYYDDEGYDGFDDYDPEEDSWDTEDETDTDTADDTEDSSASSDSTTTSSTTTSSSTTTTTTTSGTGRTSTTGVRRPSTTTTTTTTTTTVKVTLNPNGGKCSSSTLVVRKGYTYSSLPTPTRSGYTFKGWYTKKSGGSKVSSTTKVTTDKAHTLYAHWKEKKKEVYKVSFDGNGDGDPVELSMDYVEIEEGGKYPALAVATRIKYKFEGWFTKETDGTRVKAGDKFTANSEQTLFAHWKEDKYAWWNGEYSKAVPVTEDRVTCYVPSTKSTSKKEEYVKTGGRLAAADEIPQYVILFDDDDYEAQAEEARAQFGEDVSILLVSQESLKTGKNLSLIYRMLLVDSLYGSMGQDAIDEAAEDLGVTFYTIEML